jgi:DNA-binding NarL/FixJ family response regulator
MPVQDGIQATISIHQALPTVRIVFLTTFDAPELLVEGLRAGASGYLLKDCTAEELCNAVRTVARGQVFLQSASAAQLLSSVTVSSTQPPQSVAETLGLTERELDVLRLMVRGHTNSEIASELSVAEVTVKTHINHIFAKLGARDRTHAVVLVHQLGLIP